MEVPEVEPGSAAVSTPAATAGHSPAVAAVGITKRFPGVVANDHVSFEASPGEVHALLGENGAGKTTLCNVLMGLYRPDDGELFVAGSPVRLRSPRDAHQAGIFMVHQHFRLVESMSVAENVVLGWSRRGQRFSRRQVERQVAEVAERYRMSVDPKAKIWQLSLGERQRVEILKSLYRGARILILDEPTSVLTPQEAEQLFSSVREMAAGGDTVIFISHKLKEVMAVSDRITILRKGRSIGTVATADTDPRQLARLMVGRDFNLEGDAHEGASVVSAAPVLELESVSAESDFGTQALRSVSLDLFGGEVLGIAGVAGNGQRELAEVIVGLRPSTGGTIRTAGGEMRTGDARDAIERRIAYVPEDRMGTGVAPNLSIVENLMLKSYRDASLHRGPILRMKRANANAVELMKRFDVRAPGAKTLVRQLSGGNVQKVLLARELSSDPLVLVASSPTRGLDVGATQYVREVLSETARRGVGVLLISEDLDEIFELSDRIAVLYEGRVVGVVDPGQVDNEKLGLMMAGASS